MAARPELLLSVFVSQPTSSFLEWLAYHRTIGVTHNVVFIDRRQAGKQPLLDALAAAGAVTLMPVAVDPDVKEEVHNSAIRAARLEHEEDSGFGLYLADDEYFCMRDGEKDLQSLMRDCGDADVLSAPVQVALTDTTQTHSPGPVLERTHATIELGVMRSAVRMGLFRSRSMQGPTGPVRKGAKPKWVNGDGATMPKPASLTDHGATPTLRGHSKAMVLKVPAPSVETYLLRQQTLPPRQHPSADIHISRLEPLIQSDGEALEFELSGDATAAEIAKLMQLPGVAAAQEALCDGEISMRNKLRKTSKDFNRVLARFADDDPVKDGTDEGDDSSMADDGSAVAAATVALPAWFAEIHTGGDNEGSYTRLKNHAVVHIQRDTTCLVVTFDNLSNVNDITANREPWAYKIVRENGFSHLSVMARRKDWYRDPQLIAHLQRLADDGFFATFDRVIFSGTSMGGFAALAFASLAPGCTVVSFNPQTTLDQSLVPWELRFGMGRARDWTLPFSDCATQIGNVKQAFVLYDPFFTPDRRHVERLQGDNVVHLKTWCSGHFSPVFLRRAELLKPLMQHAFDDTLTPAVFYKMFRARRTLPWYRKALMSNLKERGHDQLARRVTPAFRKLRKQMAK